MSDLTTFYTLNNFQWSQPTAQNPRLSAPVSASATTLTTTSAPLDEDGNVVGGNILIGCKDKNGYTESIYVPSGTLAYDAQTANFTVGKVLTGGTSGARAYIIADTDSGTTGTLTLAFVSGTFQNDETITDDNSTPGSATANGTLTNSVSADGLTLSNCVRGVDLGGLDPTTQNTSSNAVKHDQDDPVFNQISAIHFDLMQGALQGTISSGGVNWKIGRGTAEDINIYAATGDANEPFWGWDESASTFVYSNDGINTTSFGTGAGVSAGDGIATIVAGVIAVDLAASNSGLEFSSGELQIDHSEFQNQTFVYQGTDTGAANAYAVSLTPNVTAYTEGLCIEFKAANASTGASTLNVDSLGPKTIKKNNDQDIASGDIESGQIVRVTYDGTNFQMTSVGAASVSSADAAVLTGGSTTDAGDLHKHAIAHGVDNWTVSANSQTKVIAHGLGRTPNMVTVNWGQGDANINDFSEISYGVTTYDGTNTNTVYYLGTGASSGAWRTTTESAMIIQQNNATDWASTVAVDSTNITFTSKSYANTRTAYFHWRAE